MSFAQLGSRKPLPDGLRNALIASRGVALLLLLSGAVAILAWATGWSRLAAPITGWRPMRPLGAFNSVVLALALWAWLEGWMRVALLATGVVLVVVVGALIASLLGWYQAGGGNPVPESLLLIIAAVGLLAGQFNARPDLEKLTMGLAGLALVALTITVTFARAVGVFSLDATHRMQGTSFQLMVTMLLLGLCFVAMVWASGAQDLEPPEWLPAATALASLIVVTSLWSALVERDRSQEIEGAREAALAESRLLTTEIRGTTTALYRAAESAAAGATIAQQQRELESLQREVPGLEASFRLVGDGRALTQVPASADGAAIAGLWRSYLASHGTSPDTALYLPLDAKANRVVVFTPICNRHCDGAMAGVLRSFRLFRPTLSDSSRTYRFSISGPAGPVEGSRQPEAPASLARRQVPLSLGGVTWMVSAWRSHDGVPGQNSLSGAVLFMGLVVTLLLPLTIQLGRSAWSAARDRERTRLSYALERSTDGLWDVHLPTGRTMRSPSLWRNLQYPAETVPTDLEGWTSLIHPEDRPAVELAMARHLEGERESYETEYRVRARDGTWHIVVDRGRVVDRNATGAPVRLLGISADVTEARAIALAHERSERRFRTLFNSGFQFQLLLNSECRVLEANHAALEHARLAPEQVLARLAWDTLWWSNHPAAQQILRDACASANSGRTEIWEQEIRVDGRPPMILEISLKPIEGTDGTSNQLLLEGRDITERRRTEMALKETETLTTMGRLAARVAHEINNPLAGIQNAFMLIKDAVPPDHPHIAYVGAIHREIERISKVTRQLYETYRPERDTSGTASVEVIVGDAVAFMEQVNRTREVRLVAELAGVPSQVPVSAAVLRQVIYNLVQNAIDASPPGSAVTVAASTRAGWLELRVRDEGPGIPESMRDRIFETFFSTKEKMLTSGMGLGLALVRRTVLASGGTITVNNHPEGGAEFLVVLPLESNGDGGTR